jgi:Uri superfamily endonuclease
MRQGKSVHRHIDQLTERGIITGIWIVPKGRECDLASMLAQLPVPIPGFGSSDCGRCRSHLLHWPVCRSEPLRRTSEDVDWLLGRNAPVPRDIRRLS